MVLGIACALPPLAGITSHVTPSLFPAVFNRARLSGELPGTADHRRLGQAIKEPAWGRAVDNKPEALASEQGPGGPCFRAGPAKPFTAQFHERESQVVDVVAVQECCPEWAEIAQQFFNPHMWGARAERNLVLFYMRTEVTLHDAKFAKHFPPNSSKFKNWRGCLQAHRPYNHDRC